MGKKVICFIIYFFVVLYSYGQDMYTEKINWEEHVENITCSDTCDIVSKIQERCTYELIFYKKMLTIGDQSFYCVFVPIGSGIPLWLISVYKKTENNWNLVARGTIVRDRFVLSARFSSNNDKILFFTVSSGADKVSPDLKSLVDKEEEIGELSLCKFLH